jgi:integrase
MLTIYRRHLKRCKHRAQGRKYRHCQCPIWVDGILSGVEIRESLKMRDWQRAQELVREWETEGRQSDQQGADPLTVKEACEKFIADSEARGLRATTLYKYRLLFRQLQEFARENGLRFLSECDIDFLRRFRASWPNRNIAARKKLESLRTFSRFAHDSGWIAANPGAKLKPPKITDRPTMPFTRDEFTRILAACGNYPDKLNAIRLRALVLLLRYSGLRITDAVTLRRDRITDAKLFLYTAKTGTAVYCPLPPFLMTALEAVPTVNEHFSGLASQSQRAQLETGSEHSNGYLLSPWCRPVTLTDSGILLRWNCYLPASQWSVCPSSWAIIASALPRSTTLRGSARGRSNSKPMYDAPGRKFPMRRVHKRYASNRVLLTDCQTDT